MSSFGVSSNAYLSVAVNYSKDATRTVPWDALTSPMSNPVSAQLMVNVVRTAPDQILLWWFGAPSSALLQVNPTFDPNNWLEILEQTYSGGRNFTPQTLFFNEVSQFYRLIAQ